MIIYSSKEAINFYYENPAVNQSTLKQLENGIVAYSNALQAESKDTQYFKIGSAVDAMLTSATFDDDYFINNKSFELSDLETNIIKDIYQLVENEVYHYKVEFDDLGDLSLHTDEIYHIITKYEWQKNWKFETRVSKIIDKGSDYFRLLVQTSGKIILSTEEYEIVTSCVERIKTLISKQSVFQPNSNRDICYQLPLYFNHTSTNIACKALLDVVVVTKDNYFKNINVYPFDIKTTSASIFHFEKSFWKYRYDFQADFYRLALLTEFEKTLKMKYPDYKIFTHPMSFIAVSTTTTEPAVLFKYVDNDPSNLESIFSKLSWHIDNNIWDVDKEIYENDCVVEIHIPDEE